MSEEKKPVLGYPEHVAIIMDGNGRWANDRGLNRVEGHKRGVETVDEIVTAASELGVKTLVLYAFSNENWNRPKAEVAFLMKHLADYLDAKREKLINENIQFDVIGRINDLPQNVVKRIKRNQTETSKNTGLKLILALSYGGRQEIIDATKRISVDVLEGQVSPKDIDEELFSRYLYYPGAPDIDLLIRTSGEMRVSNFLLWQISYSELYVTETLWPDFKPDNLVEALEAYQKRERRFGLTSKQQQKKPSEDDEKTIRLERAQ